MNVGAARLEPLVVSPPPVDPDSLSDSNTEADTAESTMLDKAAKRRKIMSQHVVGQDLVLCWFLPSRSSCDAKSRNGRDGPLRANKSRDVE